MIGICAEFTCQSGKNAEFEKLLTEFVTTVKANEAGTISYELVQSKKNPDNYFMLELYANQEALDAHGKTAHMTDLVSKIGGFLAAPPVIHEGKVIN